MWSAMARALALFGLTLALAPVVAGQVGQSGRNTIPRWEYCILQLPPSGPNPVETTEAGKVTKTYRLRVSVCMAQAGGCQDRMIESTFAIVQEGDARQPSKADLTKDALAHALAQLGAEGWELVIQGARIPISTLDTDFPVLYFKRQAR